MITSIFIDLCIGLKIIHSKEVAHRDINPENVYSSSENFKIGDFSISRIMKEKEVPSNVHMNTFFYTPQELFFHKNYTQKCDIYCLGILLYYMYAFRTPNYKCKNEIELLQWFDNQVIPDTINADKEIQDLIINMLKTEEHRPSIDDIMKSSFFKDFESKVPTQEVEKCLNHKYKRKYSCKSSESSNSGGSYLEDSSPESSSEEELKIEVGSPGPVE